MNGRPWTPDEDAILVADNGKTTAAELATRLDRGVSAVSGRRFTLGLTRRRAFASDDQIAAALLVLHPIGWSDAEIAERLSSRLGVAVNRHRVGRIRGGLGLPTNRRSEHQRQRVAAKTREQLQAAGVESLADVRRKHWDDWKRSLGWPAELTIRAVQALEMFYRFGPMTRVQLCHSMGISPKKRTEPTSNAKGGTVLAELQRAGLVMRLPKQVQRGTDRRGGVRRVDLYTLEPGVTPDGNARNITQEHAK